MSTPLFRPNSTLLNDKYRIEAYIGAGSFGQVYKVRHVRLDTLRALKVLHPEMTGVGSTALTDYKKRFDLEAKLGAKIDHPNVVKVHNFEADAAGALLLEMEYVPGGTLADLLKQGPAPIERVMAVLRDGLAGLTAMHEHALGTFVHRDLKPSNILLDATGRAKIADLGSAQTPWDNPSLLGTLAPPHPGTAGYRSPEHEVGNSLLTPSADIYGLGCVVFELLTGKRWFDAQRDADGPRDLRRDVPDWLDAIVRRMLHEMPGKKKADRNDATKRYVDCRDVAQAMQATSDDAAAQTAAQAAVLAREREQQAAIAVAEAEQQRQATVWAEQVERERQAAAAEAERRKREAAQMVEHARQAEAAISAARWGETRRQARAWLALQPDSARARAALKLSEEEQGKLNKARTRRALLLGGGGAGVLGLGYVASRLVLPSGSATPTPRPTLAPSLVLATQIPPTAAPQPTSVPSPMTALPSNLKMDELIATAKKEGELNVISLPHNWANYGEIISTFKTKYGLKINEINPDAGSADQLEAIKVNKDSKDPQTPDVIDVGFVFAPQSKAAQLIQPYKVSTWNTIPDNVKDAEGYWYGAYYGVIAFEVNKSVIKNIPQDWADLLKPEYKSQIALAGDPRKSSQAINAVFAASLGSGGNVDNAAPGLEFFKKLNASGNLVPVIAKPSTIAKGETPIALRWDYNALQNKVDSKGNPEIEVVVPKSGVLAGSVYVQAISAYAPHPNTAKLWMEFLYSDEGQLLWLKGFAHPIRYNDLVQRNAIPEALARALPSADSYAKAVFPTLSQFDSSKNVIIESWDKVVGANIK